MCLAAVDFVFGREGEQVVEHGLALAPRGVLGDCRSQLARLLLQLPRSFEVVLPLGPAKRPRHHQRRAGLGIEPVAIRSVGERDVDALKPLARQTDQVVLVSSYEDGLP
jgi:hypothetical protein